MKLLDAGSAPAPYTAKLKPLTEVLAVEEAKVKVKPYSFSRALANRVGIIPAMILKFIAHKVYTLRNERDNKFWYYGTYREIAKQYPFLSESSVNRAIELLASEEQKLLIIGSHNRRKGDKTRWFSVTEEVRNLCEADLIYFDPKDANIVGLKAAIVFYHLNYTFKNKPDLLKEGVWLKIWPSDLAAHQPLSPLEAHSALRQLALAGYLLKDDSNSGSCYYTSFGRLDVKSEAPESEADPHENGARPL